MARVTSLLAIPGIAFGVAALIAIPHWIQDDGRLLTLYGQRVKHTDISKYPMLGGAMDQSLHVIALFLTALLIGS